MIKTLKRKFIYTAMLAITILLVFLTAAISLVNAVNENKRAEHILMRVARTELKPPRGMHQPPEPRFAPPVSADDAMAARFFAVFFDENGNLIRSDVHRISAVTADEAEAIAHTVYSKGDEHGRYKQFRYTTQPTDMGGRAIFFLDFSMYTRGIIAVSVISLLLATICWTLMLCVVILLSKKMIHPIAVGFEKQKQFVTDAGHEIKTPLAIIRSNTEALELYNGETRWSINIKNQVTRLSQLTENLLTLAKLDEAPVYTATEFSLSEAVCETLSPFSDMANEKNLVISTDISPQIKITGNRDAITRMISALADNAVKYSPNGKNIGFSLKADAKHAVFTAHNYCEAPPDDCLRLFDRFYRGDSARTQKNGGFGIGLSVAQGIAHAHRGSIAAEYNDGKITFTILLPL